MTQPAHYLFSLWDGGGNVAPQMSVARALVDRGHTVRVLADPVLAADVRAAGAEHVAWTTAPHRTTVAPETQLAADHDTANPLLIFRRIVDELTCGPAARFAADARAEIARRRPDVVVASDALLGVRIAAEAEGLPCASLFANPMSFRGWGTPPLGPGFPPARGPLGRLRDDLVGRAGDRLWSRGLRDVNAARAAHGLAPVATVLEQIMAVDRMLILTSPAFELPGFTPPAHVRIAGARLDDPAWAGDWTPPPGDAPLVLVALSSTYQAQEDVLRRAVAALAGLPVRGLVTTGPSVDPATVDAPANVIVVARAPHSEVLRHAAACVTHGGHGTLIKALAAGVPVVVLPMGRDQLDNAARAAHHGAGVRLRPKAAPGRIAEAVRRVLADPAYAGAAGRLAGAIAAEGREDRAVAELEALRAIREAGVLPSPRRVVAA
ncbi:MAG TPA: glycosyltransferase [Solirubrobacteraceae bacterium]|jgi:MGT family glycosyltransferase